MLLLSCFPRLAMLGLDFASRQPALTSHTDGLPRNTAGCVIKSGQYEKAVELLEGGRSVLVAGLRTPMTDLRDVVPELQEQMYIF